MFLNKPKFWNNSNVSIWSIILFPFSIVYLLISKFNKIKTSKKFRIPIVCVGNIYLGGTGKTPLALEIYNIYKSLGKNPGFVKKYYDYLEDEIEMLKNKGEIYISKNRIEAIDNLINSNKDIAILDDGFQDQSIYKNFNIACFNQKQWIGNSFLIPAGPLREKLSALKRADCILINGKKDTKIENQIYNVNKSIKIFYSKYKALDIDRFKGKKICAFAGIGNPSNFFELLKESNLNLVNTFAYSDHHDYSYTDIETMVNNFNDCIFLTTEKDYCRINQSSFLKDFKIEYLKIKLEIENKEDFIKLIKDKI